jgi:hypothetical protein
MGFMAGDFATGFRSGAECTLKNILIAKWSILAQKIRLPPPLDKR